jgi:hypothetical protein
MLSTSDTAGGSSAVRPEPHESRRTTRHPPHKWRLRPKWLDAVQQKLRLSMKCRSCASYAAGAALSARTRTCAWWVLPFRRDSGSVQQAAHGRALARRGRRTPSRLGDRISDRQPLYTYPLGYQIDVTIAARFVLLSAPSLACMTVAGT